MQRECDRRADRFDRRTDRSARRAERHAERWGVKLEPAGGEEKKPLTPEEEVLRARAGARRRRPASTAT